MRIYVPEELYDNPTSYVAENYAPDILAAGYNFSRAVYQHCSLSLREAEAARMRTAQINGCLICKNWRSKRDLPSFFEFAGGDADTSFIMNGPAPDEAFYEAIEDWHDSSIFSDREKLIIEYAEGLGQDPQGIAANEDFWTRFKAAFSDEEITDLTFSIGSWIAMGRATHVLGMDTSCGV